MKVNQSTFLHQFLEEHGMSECSSTSTPIHSKIDLSPATNEEIIEGRSYPFRSVIGGLNWVAIGSRPDIAAAVGSLAQHTVNPAPRHFEALKTIL